MNVNASASSCLFVALLACGGGGSGPPGPVAVASVSIAGVPASLVQGRAVQLTATARSAAGDVLTGRPITWSSSDPLVAIIGTDGLVSSLVPGTTTIAATAEGKSGTAILSVVAPATGPAPSPRGGAGLAWDDAAKRVLLFGGSNANTLFNDLWAWDGQRWTQFSSGGAGAPPARVPEALVWDSARQRLVVYGGFTLAGGVASQLTDTWEWDGTAWSQRASGTPSARRHLGAGYDPVRQRVLLYGGLNASDQPVRETWEWDGQQWSLRASTTPSAQSATSRLVFLSGRNAVVMLVGSFSSGPTEFWQWNGTAWSIAGSGPTTFLPMPVAAISASDVLMLNATTGATLKWDGSSIATVATSGPGARFSSIVFDAERQQVVLFGGQQGSDFLGDTWVWDGTAWREVNK